MNKRSLNIIVLLAALIGGALYFTNFLQSPIIHLTHAIKLNYLQTLESFENTLEEHFDQQAAIMDLREKNRYYEKELLTLHQVANEYQNLLREHNSTIKISSDVALVRTLSYVRFGDPHKLWMEIEHYDPTRVYGLLYRGYAAGIVVSHNDRPMALLNGDVKSSYAVNIGDSMAPGIVRGMNSRELLVEFIPTWIPIAIGDEVTTSGLDQIFMQGLKVGKVVSISRAQGYQSAVIKPYFYGKNPAYFHVIKVAR